MMKMYDRFVGARPTAPRTRNAPPLIRKYEQIGTDNDMAPRGHIETSRRPFVLWLIERFLNLKKKNFLKPLLRWYHQDQREFLQY